MALCLSTVFTLLFGLLNSAPLNFVCWNAVHNNKIQLQLNEGDPTKQNIWNTVNHSIQATKFLRSLIYSESQSGQILAEVHCLFDFI